MHIHTNDTTRLRWIATHILPLEHEVRGWLAAHARSLSQSDIDDVIQEAYARIWKTGCERITEPRAYLYTTVRNLLAEQARRARVVPMERMGEIDSLRIISDEPGPERRESARQELVRLMAAVAELPPQCRQAFELRKFKELSQREIAAAMGIAEKTVEKHLAKALTRITQAMDADRTQAENASAGTTHAKRHHTD